MTMTKSSHCRHAWQHVHGVLRRLPQVKKGRGREQHGLHELLRRGRAVVLVVGDNDVLEGHELFTRIRRPVAVNSDQIPEYSDIRKAGHDGGDFLFIVR